jgi:hypothetical protein
VWSAGPVRVYLGLAGVGGGAVRVFCFSGSVLAGTVRLNRWGWRDSTDFLFSWFCFGGYGTMVGGAVFNFSLSSVCCQFPWRVDMRGRDIALFSMVFVVVSCGFIYSSC